MYFFDLHLPDNLWDRMRSKTISYVYHFRFLIGMITGKRETSVLWDRFRVSRPSSRLGRGIGIGFSLCRSSGGSLGSSTSSLPSFRPNSQWSSPDKSRCRVPSVSFKSRSSLRRNRVPTSCGCDVANGSELLSSGIETGYDFASPGSAVPTGRHRSHDGFHLKCRKRMWGQLTVRHSRDCPGEPCGCMGDHIRDAARGWRGDRITASHVRLSGNQTSLWSIALSRISGAVMRFGAVPSRHCWAGDQLSFSEAGILPSIGSGECDEVQ
jgi:hypothetical protein